MPFTVTVLPSGRSFSVERDEPILVAAIRQGVGLPYGCKDGACGSCKCRLLEGRVIHGAHSASALSVAEEAAGLTLTCQAAAQTDVVIEARTVAGAGEFPVRKMPTRVISIEKPAPDVAIVSMQLPANDVLRYHPGQYIEFILAGGLRRSYSMANAPHTLGDKPALELHVRLMPGGRFTEHVFNVMKPKDILRIEGPFGTFFLREDSDKPMIFVAGSTGFAPVKSMLEYAFARGMKRRMLLYWGVRRLQDLYLGELPRRWAREHENFTFVPVLSDPAPEDRWTGRTGLVHEAILADFPDLAGYQVYACGSVAMVEAAHPAFRVHGLAQDDCFADAFRLSPRAGAEMVKLGGTA